MCRGLSPSGALLSFVRSSSRGPSKQSEDMKTHSTRRLCSHTQLSLKLSFILSLPSRSSGYKLVSLLLHLHPVKFKGLWTEPQESRYVNGD